MSDNDQIIDEFRTHGGVVGGPFEGKHLLLLHTVGRRTGAERINPLVYATDSGSLVVCGSNGGAEKDPQWVSNVDAMSEVTIEIGERTLRATPTVVSAPEEDWKRLHDVWGAYWPPLSSYETKTDRRFPLILLDPVVA
ncbi:nitroreductase/quinone reductase family protein [Streptomyces sp. NPDC051569]|uniref:nitroreductase/quinone reductase family protein n=1 Tax=Streptomyces sp. NPDC051569 TaxID=3365661 RepID=UPI0037B60B9E